MLLGSWICTGFRRRYAYWATLLTFVVFAVVSGYSGWVGAVNCGCFGSIKTSPWIAFGVDLVVIGALLFVRKTEPDHASDRRSLLAPVPSMVLFGVISFLAFVGWAFLQYGSISVAAARLKGESVTVDQSALDLGMVKSGEIHEKVVKLTNWGDHPIRIIGVPGTCLCHISLPLPIEITSHGTLEIPVQLFVPKSNSGVFQHTIHIWIDSGVTRVVRCDVSGFVARESVD